MPPRLLHDGDPFGPAAREQFAAEFTDPAIVTLIVHCEAAAQAVAPSRRWTTEANRLLAAAPGAEPLLVGLLELFCDQELHEARGGWGGLTLVHDTTAGLLRGVVAAAALGSTAGVSGLLLRVASHAARGMLGEPGSPQCPRVASSAIAALARRADDQALAGLLQLERTVRNRPLRARLASSLAEVGATRGVTADELRETAVPTSGLDPHGRFVRDVGEHRFVITVAEPGVAALTVLKNGKQLKAVPAAARSSHRDEVTALRRLTKQITGLLGAERTRVDALLSCDRSWLAPAWIAQFAEHPVTGAIGRTLLWQVSDDGAVWRTGVPRRGERGWELTGLDGPIAVGPQSVFRLWHPLRVGVAETAAWRDAFVADRRRQAIKQVFREVYLVTPAEEETHAYSNRLAGHILGYRQAGALLGVRGWHAKHLGYWEDGYNGEARKEFGGGAWRARFYCDLVERDTDEYQPRYCSSDQVRFERRTASGWETAPVATVAPLVLSEAMRDIDIDLVVGVTSIAADNAWSDRGEHRFGDYWEQATFGELNGSAQMRREALARLLPRTKIADRVELTDRFLRVHGHRATYKIHLGSANILIEPGDRYLCIVVTRGKKDQLFLPFDDDERLAVILSKAFLLADDHTITDTTITRQLPVASGLR